MQKVTLTREKETLLITLYAKAGERRMPDSLLRDRLAAEAVDRIDYDFTRLKVKRDLMVGMAIRAKTLDRARNAWQGEAHSALPSEGARESAPL